MKFKIEVYKKPKLENPILIEGLPGIGNVGKIAAKYLIRELRAKKFATLYSDTFPPNVIIRKSGLIAPMKNSFYYYKKDEKEFIIVTGNTQSTSPEGQYKLTEEILNFTQQFGIKTIYTLGGLGVGRFVEKPKVFAAVTSKKFVKKLEELGVVVKRDAVGQLIGVSGLLLALGKLRGIDGVCLMGETSGLYIDHNAALAVLRVLTELIEVEIDVEKLKEKAKASKKKIAEITKVERRIIEDLGIIQKEPSEEETRYIG